MEFMVDPDDSTRFRCSLKNFFTHIGNQKRHPNCVAHALSDMSICIHRMHGVFSNSSPQPIIDGHIRGFRTLGPFMCDDEKGTQSCWDYHFTRINGELRYQPGLHHTFDDYQIIKGLHKIKEAFLDNFGQDGPKLPIMAGVQADILKPLKIPPTAKNAFYGKPFKVDRNTLSKLAGKHAILITGVDVMDANEDNQSVEWRNSWGPKFGADGYTKVTFDFFRDATILVPILDMENRKQIHRFCITNLVGHKNAIKDMCFSACGRVLATASEDGVRVFDVRDIDVRDAESKSIECVMLKTPGISHPTSICFIEDSIVVATKSKASLCMFAKDESNNQNYNVKWCNDNLGGKPIFKILGSKSSRFFLTSSADPEFRTLSPEFRIWFGEDYGKELQAGMAQNNIISISPDGKYLAAAVVNIVMVRLLSEAKEDWEPAFSLKGHVDDVTSVCFTPDSERVIAASRDGSLRVWTLTSDSPSHSELQPTAVFQYILSRKYENAKFYQHISVSPDGKMLAVCGASLLRWILVESGRILETIGQAHKGDITSMTWAPGRVGDKRVFVLATSGVDKCVKLWAAPKVWAAPGER